MEMKSGQAFVLGSVIFTSLFLIAMLPAGPQIRSGDSSDIQRYFQKAVDEKKRGFNKEIGQNKSADYLKRKLYIYNQFLQQSAGLKGSSYQSYDFFVLPDEGEALFINFRDVPTDVSVHDGDWTNRTVKSYQFSRFDVDGNGNITVSVKELSNRHEMRSTKPMLAFWMRMTRQSQSVERTYTG